MTLPVPTESPPPAEGDNAPARAAEIQLAPAPEAAAARAEPGTGPLTLRGITFAPARFCAPMAGLTHSAFRRLVADFGGHGALFTEMICGRWLLREDANRSPALKRRPEEGRVIYQLMLTAPEEVAPAVERLADCRPDGLDLNCACPAPKIRQRGAGSELFTDRPRLEGILRALRREWPGVLTVKIRLGRPEPSWRTILGDRLRLFADCGVDAVTLHPRFADEKLKRRARHEVFPELLAETRLPLIASGDLHGPEGVRRQAAALAGVAGIMVGRLAVVRPWIFRAWSDPDFFPEPVAVWERFVRYVREDFPEPKAFLQARVLVTYLARNFRFGHRLFALAQGARTWAELVERVGEFLENGPERLQEPDLSGLA